MKLIKSDIVIAVILLISWLIYLSYEGTTRFDVNQRYTLPLFIAAELTALAILYAAGRYFTAKKSREINQKISSMMVDPEDEQTQVETATENSKS